MNKRLHCLLLIVAIFGSALLIPGSSTAQEEPPRIIFMHHSTGENLIREGNVRQALAALGYPLWDHGYNGDGLTNSDGTRTGSNYDVPGDNTDPDGWVEIFDQPVTDPPQNTFSHMLQYDVIIFKSCFPCSHIVDEAMFRAYQNYFLQMRDVMAAYPDKLFIPFTTPPLVPNETTPEAAALARRWSQYLTSAEYQGGYNNIVVFDFFTHLADGDNVLRTEYRADEWDSHPNTLANQTVGPIFVDFVAQAIADFVPGEAPEPAAIQPPQATDTPSPPAVVEQGNPATLDDFESGDFSNVWWTYADDNAPFSCAITPDGIDGSQALQFIFDLPVDRYAGCGRELFVDPAVLASAAGIQFAWRAEAPGQPVAIILILGEEQTPFETYLLPGSTSWETVTLPWALFQRAEWAETGGIEVFDPALVRGIDFPLGNWDGPQQGAFWLDDITLYGDASTSTQPVAEAPAPTTQRISIDDKYSLWINGTQLRGANIWQRIVYPEVDGTDYLGSGRVGPPFTQDDFDRLAALGANYVNISHPGLFTQEAPFVLDEAVQANLDTLLTMIEAADMFAVISFRTGPGRSDFTFYRDGMSEWFDASYLREWVFEDAAAQTAWAEMWRYTAERYRDHPIVVGYELMVEPNAAGVLLNIYEPSEFYARYEGTTYDWNQFYPPLVDAIRAVDANTPILIPPMGWSAVRWLPALAPSEASNIVYAVHQYEPQMQYTHREQMPLVGYPSEIDLDWDGQPDTFDIHWLDTYLSTIDDYRAAHGNVPVAVTEFGVGRWIPDNGTFMADQMSLFEARGLNYALWDFHATWEPFRENDAFDFLHGSDPYDHTPIAESPLLSAITEAWARNTIRPSTFAE